MSDLQEDLSVNNPFFAENESKEEDLSKNNPFISDEFNLPQSSGKTGSMRSVFDKVTYPILGAGAGLAAGIGEKRLPKKESISSVINEINNLRAAGKIQEASLLAQIKLGGGIKESSVQDIFDLYQRASGPKIEGDSGVKNWMKAEAGQNHQLPEAVLDIATDKTKESPTGGKGLIEKDIKNIKIIGNLGYGDYKLTDAKPGQIMIPSKVADELSSLKAATTQTTEINFSKKIQEIEDLISKGKKSEAISRLSSLFGGGPITGAIMGGLGGLQVAEAARAAKEGDIPTAAIQGVGGLGSLATLIPKAFPRLIGGGAAAASIPAQFLYEAIKGIPKERMENVSARKRFEALPVQPSKQEIMAARYAGPAISAMNLSVPQQTQIAGGLSQIQ
jgi:hypothetical protein